MGVSGSLRRTGACPEMGLGSFGRTGVRGWLDAVLTEWAKGVFMAGLAGLSRGRDAGLPGTPRTDPCKRS